MNVSKTLMKANLYNKLLKKQVFKEELIQDSYYLILKNLLVNYWFIIRKYN
jgi:hypothetical protein